MKNTKAVITAALAAPLLALTGGIAYASTTSHPAPARTVVTATAQHPTGQDRLGWCDWRYTGHWCDRRDHGHQAQAAHQHHAGRHHNYRHHYGYQHRGDRTWSNQSHGYQGYGYQGGWGYGYQGTGHQGHWGTGSGSHWSNGGGCCRHGW